jgi:hypothetical protein
MADPKDRGARDKGAMDAVTDAAQRFVSNIKTPQPSTQEKAGYREGWPAWAKQFPKWTFNKPNDNYQLIDREQMRNLFKTGKYKDDNEAKAALDKLEEDMDFLDKELLRLFRARDYNASKNQNNYRLYQIGFASLAALATIIGSFQALAVNDAPDVLPYLAFAETVVALFTTYLATISGRATPLPAWLENRRHAEYLRREYYRYLMDLEPYDGLSGFERKQQLSIRAANINRGIYPDSSANG